ncbi:pectate lyase [Paludisphaera rhizosphaerae]|uniref:pectate lyase n=1 Tax=Paludisphaera rhizosphaerae TaxID=2711216 RepID=UPI0013EB6EAB|nr:pectate lyase [Paludisphaera rhizosphaerae]
MAVKARRLGLLLAVVVVEVVLSGGGRPAFGASFSWKKYAEKPPEWYRGEEGRKITACILSNQSPAGDWPKNFDTSAVPYTGDRNKIEGTFDNGATFGELRFLARAFQATGDAVDREAFLRGFDHATAAQYPNGGFPQHFPTSRKGYDRHITFNDGTMVNILQFLRDVADSDDFAFVDAGRSAAAVKAFDKGIACILACQIKVNGKLTAWCAQHDETTLAPAPARAFELVSISGGESGGILQLLMSLPNPSPEVVQAIEAGVTWYDSAKLTGIRQEIHEKNKVIVQDPAAPPLWARFYEVDTNRPFFCGRDGVKKYDVAEIEAERRNGYAWYGNWGEAVAKRYAAWQAGRKKAA